SALKHPRACVDTEGVEQLGELAVEIAAEFGDDRIGEAGAHRARLVDGQPGPVLGVDVDQGAQWCVEHHGRVVEIDPFREGAVAPSGTRCTAEVRPGPVSAGVMSARQYRTKPGESVPLASAA